MPDKGTFDMNVRTEVRKFNLEKGIKDAQFKGTGAPIRGEKIVKKIPRTALKLLVLAFIRDAEENVGEATIFFAAFVREAQKAIPEFTLKDYRVTTNKNGKWVFVKRDIVASLFRHSIARQAGL